VNKRFGQLLRTALTAAGFEVTRVGRGASGTPVYCISEGIISDLLTQCLGDAPRITVDIAAADGKSGSNTFALFALGWTGLAVEAEPPLFARLALNYRSFDRVALYRGWITPINVASLMGAAGIPSNFGFLSLDIDGYDHDVLDAILGQFRPRLICAEINERFPPPIRFNVPYSPAYRYRGDGFFGQSLSMLDALRSRHDYVLVRLDYINAFLVPRESGMTSITPEEAYAEGYVRRTDRKRRFPWNEDFEPLQSMHPDNALPWILEKFSAHRGEFYLSAGETR
jgi:hypothetical protein